MDSETYVETAAYKKLAGGIDEWANKGQGAIWAISGPPGTGKSALVSRAAVLARERLPELRLASTICQPRIKKRRRQRHRDDRDINTRPEFNTQRIPSDQAYWVFIQLLLQLGEFSEFEVEVLELGSSHPEIRFFV